MSFAGSREIMNHLSGKDILVKCPSREMEKVNVFTKEDYRRIVREKRKEFVHQFFADELNKFFGELSEEASFMKHCHFEVTFEVPLPFDVNRTEEILRNYFKDLKYEAIPEPRKGDTNKIVLTLT